MMKKNMIWIYPIFIMCVLSILMNGCKKEVDNSNTLTDKDGNVYHTVTIGSQVWMAENLKATKYNDGTAIPLVTVNTSWETLTSPGYCWSHNDAATYKATYGALYNWYTVNTGKLCPTGWHVPTDAEWTTLTTYLGGESIAGSKLKESGAAYWEIPNNGTNETGFTALPGGFRYDQGGFDGPGIECCFWSSTECGPDCIYCRVLRNHTSKVDNGFGSKGSGYSVRCLKN